MPYGCMMDGGSPKLFSAGPTAYPILGPREEREHMVCPASGQSCETLMLHKFMTECDGQRVPFARLASGAPAGKVAMPSHLPAGFAPVSRLAGRLVLPSLARPGGAQPQVAMQDLSPDSVVDRSERSSRAGQVVPAGWVTEVRADALLPGAGTTGSAGANGLRVASVVAALVSALLAASYVLARHSAGVRRAFAGFDERGPHMSWTQGVRAWTALWTAVWHQAMGRIEALLTRVGARRGGGDANADGNAAADDDVLTNALMILETRAAHAEMLIASLPARQLLRDVLQGELRQVRARAQDSLARRAVLGTERTHQVLRGALHDLDRIVRLAQGAGADGQQAESPAAAIPQTVYEAYRVLGLNADAPAQAVKKIVDGLRMTWHPDHARDDADRAAREERMKQINTAWDLIRAAQAAA